MFKRSALALSIALVLGSTAHATGHKPPPKPLPPSSSNSSHSTSLSGSSAQARQEQAQRASARSASASAANTDVAVDAASSASNGDDSVYVEGDSSSYRARALALSLPGLVAAPAVPGQCLEHHAGWGIASAGKTGFTKLAEGCLAHVQCLARADRYFAWGRTDLALAQLTACDGIDPGKLTQENIVVHDEISREEFEKNKEDMNTKIDRAFKKAQEK